MVLFLFVFHSYEVIEHRVYREERRGLLKLAESIACTLRNLLRPLFISLFRTML